LLTTLAALHAPIPFPAAVLDTPATEPAAPTSPFHILLVKGFLAVAAAGFALIAAGALLYMGAMRLMGSAAAVATAWLGVEMAFW
jgi:hypothetical protein